MNYDERIDETPQVVQNILSSFDEMKDGYSECARIIEELNTIGWTAEYGLDAELFNLKLMDFSEVDTYMKHSHGQNIIIALGQLLELLKVGYELTEEDFIFLDKIHQRLELDDEVCLKMNEIEQVEFYLQKL